MWDLTVSDVHTFAVGQGQWVVHNAGPCPNGNSLSSTNPQHLYEVTKTDVSGSTTTVKFGVSGGPVSAAGNSYRATRQVNGLNRAAQAAGTGDTFSAAIRAWESSRRDILDLETSAVYGFKDAFGFKPPGNIRP
jgi:hypothetical protein